MLSHKTQIYLLICISTILVSLYGSNNDALDNEPMHDSVLAKTLYLNAVGTVADMRFKSSYIDSNGAVGTNQVSWSNLAIQVEAAYLGSIVAIRNNDYDLANRCLKTVEFALSHQNNNGTFTGSSAKDKARFIVLSCAALTFLEKSMWTDKFVDRINYVVSKFHKIALWVKDHSASEPAIHNTNIKAAVALVLLKVGFKVDNDELFKEGESYLKQVFVNQDNCGFYLEEGGWDSSYQMVTCFLLYSIYIAVFFEVERQTQIIKSLELAYEWEKQRIDKNSGKIDGTGNTRTANEIAKSPESKSINYFEATLSLAYLYSLGFEQADIYADSVARYLVENVN